VLRYSAHFTEPGALILEHACRLSLEGVVSKLKDGAYVSGRGNGWVKSKCNERQEFVIGGYVPSSTGASAIGSLVLGVYDGKKLHHAGRVGTGFTVKVAADLFRRLDKLGVSSSPFSEKLSADAARQVRFVRPELVAEVEFRGWTAERSVRHASFRGLREDRDPSEVKREDDSPPVADPPRVTARLTHPDRIYWPEAGVTKAGLADYYAEAWRWMAPFVAGRPLALVRCPSGLAGQCFFQKHAWQGIRDGVRLITDPADPSGEKLLTVDGLDGVVALVQAGVLEIHPWGSTVKAIEQPDFITLDLDPGEGVTWDMLIGAAEEIRARLARQGVTGFVKTSGGKGLHVVAPLIAKAGWTEVKAYTKRLAEEMAADAPGKYVATITKAKRKCKILIDYLRNGRGATAVAPYSTRARPIDGVSMPLAWDELAGSVSGDHFTVANAGARIAALARDPWEDFKAAAVALPALGARRR
jgi:bifunctional non-homologous end joining protein LigD